MEILFEQSALLEPFRQLEQLLELIETLESIQLKNHQAALLALLAAILLPDRLHAPAVMQESTLHQEQHLEALDQLVRSHLLAQDPEQTETLVNTHLLELVHA